MLLLAASSAACLRLGHPVMMGGKIVSHGPFAPAVRGLKRLMGDQELNELRAKIIGEHSKVIKQFVDTSDSPTGQIALKVLFEAADKDGNGTLDKEEVKEALQALGFTFIEDGDVDRIFKKADADKNGAWPLRERTRLFVTRATGTQAGSISRVLQRSLTSRSLSRSRPRRCGSPSSSSPSKTGTTLASSRRSRT